MMPPKPVDQQRVYAVKLLADLQEKQANLQIKCPIEGQVAELVPFSETGRYVREGEEVARITDGRWLLRVAMTEDAFGQAKVKLGTVVNVRLSGTDVRNWSGRVHSVSKVASDVVPDVRLTQIAGGPIPVHPTTLQAQAAYVEIKIELDDRLPQDVLHGMSGIAGPVPFRAYRFGYLQTSHPLLYCGEIGQLNARCCWKIVAESTRLGTVLVGIGE